MHNFITVTEMELTVLLEYYRCLFNYIKPEPTNVEPFFGWSSITFSLIFLYRVLPLYRKLGIKIFIDNLTLIFISKT